jgi:hypothetical protein
MVKLTEAEKFRLIERTCKYDANLDVWMWERGGNKSFVAVRGSAAWYAREKMLGHLGWLREQPYRYAYVEGFVKNDGYYKREGEALGEKEEPTSSPHKVP